MVKTDTRVEEEIQAIFSGDIPWVTIVWDDPVNLMTYVTYVLMELFGFTKAKAEELMMKVHTEGKAVVLDRNELLKQILAERTDSKKSE